MILQDLTYGIRGAAFIVHRKLGPGLLESAYEACLAYELKKEGYSVQRQLSLPLLYDEIKVDAGYRVDLLIERQVIVELKAVETILPVHSAQLLTYMKLADIRVGLLMNFHVKNLQYGIQRYVL